MCVARLVIERIEQSAQSLFTHRRRGTQQQRRQWSCENISNNQKSCSGTRRQRRIRTGYRLRQAPHELSAQHCLFLRRRIWRALRGITVREECMFGGAHEAGDLDRCEEGGIQEEREEAGHRGKDEYRPGLYGGIIRRTGRGRTRMRQ
jgi:hypothetical protein